jgi:hypothetical protein
MSIPFSYPEDRQNYLAIKSVEELRHELAKEKERP